MAPGTSTAKSVHHKRKEIQSLAKDFKWIPQNRFHRADVEIRRARSSSLPKPAELNLAATRSQGGDMYIQPYLFFDGRCQEALDYYVSALGAKVEMSTRWANRSAFCALIRRAEPSWFGTPWASVHRNPPELACPWVCESSSG